ncbi:MAG: hypothetical protein SVK54_06980 [candidate division WOR-3 bacterium]|nr:hypothetical protein [candidate division WOR-3 bacterium]
MEKFIDILNVFTTRNRIRIFKLVSRKMLSLKQITDATGIDNDEVRESLDRFIDIGLIKQIGGDDNALFFAKSEDSLFNPPLQGLVRILKNSFNKDKQVIEDFRRVNRIKE